MPSGKRRGQRLSGDKDGAHTETDGAAADEDTDVRDETSTDVTGPDDEPAETEDDSNDDIEHSATESTRRRRSLPSIQVSLTAALAAVLVVLLGVGTWLFLTRPVADSPVELTAFDEILSAARSGIVDVTSFDYLTLDQDIAEIDAVTVDELHDFTIAALEDRREQLVTDQQVA